MNKSKYLSILNEIKEQGGSELGDNPNENVLIIDGLNTFIRVFSVIPTTNDDGTHIGGIVGFLKSIGYTINMFRPTRCIIVFDGKGGSSRRRKLYPEYKAKRKTNIRLNRAYGFDNIEHERENMIRQIRRTIDYLEYLPITLLSIDNVEADDIIAYASKQVLTDSKVTIMSSDKDFLQLVDDRIIVWAPTKKKMYFKQNVIDDFELLPENYIIYKCLLGDKGDNVPGIRGLGHKTLIKELPILFGDKVISLEDVIEYAKNNTSTKMNLIKDNEERLYINYQLMQLHETDISGTTKEKIINIVNSPIPHFVKYDFMKMLLEDRMTIVKNIEFWIRDVFLSINTRAHND